MKKNELLDEQMQLVRKPAEFVNIPLDLRAILFESLCHYSGNSPKDDARIFLDVVLPECAHGSIERKRFRIEPV